MPLIYKFKKEKLKNGIYVSRPKILVRLHGKETSIDVPALIDSGCDTTVIPEGIAKAIGLKIEGKEIKFTPIVNLMRLYVAKWILLF